MAERAINQGGQQSTLSGWGEKGALRNGDIWIEIEREKGMGLWTRVTSSSWSPPLLTRAAH